MMRILSLLGLLLATVGPAAGQEPSPPPPGGEELVDRVIAVVGDTALLLSDLRTAVQQIQATTGRTVPTDPAERDAFMTQVLDDRVNSLLLVEAARDEGMSADEDRVQELVDRYIARLLQNFGGSQQRFEAALAADQTTLAQFREILAQQNRDDELVRAYMGNRIRARARPVISEDEIRAAFEAQQEALGTRPEHISFAQVLVKPVAGAEADTAARRSAEDVLKQLREGGDWEVLARRFSDDPGSKEVGGDIGWVKQGGGLVPEFERAAFATRPGTLTPVRSEFGYHILQVRRTQGAERQIRHILIAPDISEAAIEEARVRADSVANAIRSGANVADLARSYGTPQDEINISSRPIESLLPNYAAYATALAESQAGDVVGPFQVPGAGTESWAVVRVATRDPARPYTLADVREELVSQLQEQRMFAQIVEDLRSRIYFNVMM